VGNLERGSRVTIGVVKSSSRASATLLALLLAVLVAAPLPAALCKVGTEGSCPLMRGAEGSFCHRDGNVTAPMDCCKGKRSTNPAPVAESVGPAAPQAVLAGSNMALSDALDRLAAPAETHAASLRVAASRHELGLFTLIEVFRI
jgi:hypothetical protein